MRNALNWWVWSMPKRILQQMSTTMIQGVAEREFYTCCRFLFFSNSLLWAYGHIMESTHTSLRLLIPMGLDFHIYRSWILIFWFFPFTQSFQNFAEFSAWYSCIHSDLLWGILQRKLNVRDGRNGESAILIYTSDSWSQILLWRPKNIWGTLYINILKDHAFK